MKWIYFDDIDGTILGLSIEDMVNKDINKWHTLTDEAYQEILKYNGQYRVLLEKVKARIDACSNSENQSNDCIVTINEITKERQIDFDVEIKKKALKANQFCSMHIESGVRFQLDNGAQKRYTYKIEDQINFEQLIRLVDAGILTDDTGVLIKASGEAEYDTLSIKEFNELYHSLMKNKYYHLLYLYQYIAYIKTITDITELNRIQYETKLPDEYLNNIKAQMSKSG